jgi:hypothetical protein
LQYKLVAFLIKRYELSVNCLFYNSTASMSISEDEEAIGPENVENPALNAS